MKILFKGAAWPFPTGSDPLHSAAYWSGIFQKLRKDVPTLNSDQFYTWLETEWKCKIINNSNGAVSGISGVEIDDQAFTMLVLRFPTMKLPY
jgi:hypothetical protein